MCTCHREKQFLLYTFFFILFIQLFADLNLKENVIENNVRNVKPRFLYIFCGKTVPFISLAKCENHHEITQYRCCLLYKHRRETLCYCETLHVYWTDDVFLAGRCAD